MRQNGQSHGDEKNSENSILDSPSLQLSSILTSRKKRKSIYFTSAVFIGGTQLRVQYH